MNLVTYTSPLVISAPIKGKPSLSMAWKVFAYLFIFLKDVSLYGSIWISLALFEFLSNDIRPLSKLSLFKMMAFSIFYPEYDITATEAFWLAGNFS